MPKKLTMRELQRSIDGLKGEVGGLKTQVDILSSEMSSLKFEVSNVKTELRTVRNDVNGLKIEFNGFRIDQWRLEQSMNERFSEMFSLVDGYFRKTETWFQEHIILKARHDRLSQRLIHKGIVSEEETII